MFQKEKLKHPIRQPHRLEPQHRGIFSYHAKRLPHDTKQSSRRGDSFTKAAKQSQLRWWQYVPLFIAALLMAASLVDIVLLNTNPKVISLDDASAHIFLHSSATYQQAAQALFSRSIFNHNKVTVDTVGISRALKHDFPELSDVSIALPLIGHRPVVYITPATPALILASQNGNSFVVASSGKVLALVGTETQLGDLKLPVVNDQSHLPVQIDAPTLPAGDVTFIQTVTQQLQAQHITIQSLSLPLAASELDLQLGGQPYFVKFNLQADAKQQIGTFIATKNYLATHNLTPAHYIDVRLPGRAYY